MRIKLEPEMESQGRHNGYPVYVSEETIRRILENPDLAEIVIDPEISRDGNRMAVVVLHATTNAFLGLLTGQFPETREETESRLFAGLPNHSFVRIEPKEEEKVNVGKKKISERERMRQRAQKAERKARQREMRMQMRGKNR